MNEPALEPILIRIGDEDFSTSSITAFQGYASRVYVDEAEAIIDKASNELAHRYVSKRKSGEKMLTFAEIVSCAQADPQLFRMIADLAEHKTALETRKRT